mgnify:CR=1 FL=1
MKRILLCLFIAILLLPGNLSANINLDAFGGLNNTGDFKTHYAGGANVSFDIHRDVDFMAKYLYSTRTFNSGKDNEEKYAYMSGLIGLQYKYRIEGYPLQWISTFGIGMAKADKEYKIGVSPNLNTESKSEFGASAGVWTGILYNATQNLSPFLEIGYHKLGSISGKSDYAIQGYQVLAGVRYTFGANKSIYSDY